MKSIFKKILAGVICLGMLTSCFETFLEEKVYDFISPINFYKTEAEIGRAHV